MDSLNELIKGELVKTLTRFLNEIDVSFDYIDKSTLKNAKAVIEDSEKLDNFVHTTFNTLQKYDENFKVTLFSNKNKSKHYEFLDEIVIFDDMAMSIFSQENKNTKKTIVQYLYNIFMACHFLTIAQSNLSIEEMSQQLQSFVSEIQNQITKEDNKQKGDNVQRGMDVLPDIGNLMGSLVSNPQIFNLATEIATDLQSDNIDPMSLLSGLISGKKDAKFDSLISSITSKLDGKIKSGEIDQATLQSEALNIMNNVKDVNLPFLNSKN